MFYNYKWMFFIIFYAMCAVLYFFINKQIILTGFMSGFLFGSVVIYLLSMILSFVAAILISLISKYCYMAGCGICKVEPKKMLAPTFWMIFTLLCYSMVFITFLKMIEY